MDCPPYVSCTATTTAKGIDLVENPTQFDKKLSQRSLAVCMNTSKSVAHPKVSIRTASGYLII